jgi:16S rRNA (cytidine1402-2'-O)-methyltransferase
MTTAGNLFVVATPIGNLEDLSPRAKRVLFEADLILAEDTRVSRELLFALNAPKKDLQRFDSHRERDSIEEVKDLLRDGKQIALITDAGTPGISDPGSLLVDELQREGFSVTPIPGASAVSTFISAVGVLGKAFTFEGFLPREVKKRRTHFTDLHQAHAKSEVRHAWVWFESPERIEETLELLQNIFTDARLCLGKELTKKFERFWCGSTKFIYDEYQKLSPLEKRGEWIILLEIQGVSPEISEGKGELHSEMIQESPPAYLDALRCFQVAGVSMSDAVKAVCQVFGAPRNDVYRHGIKIFSG